MSKFNDAAVTIRKAAVKYEQMSALAELLDSIGSLDQVAKEAKIAAEKAKADAVKYKEDARKAKDKLDALVESCAAAQVEAQAAASEIVRTAEAHASEIIQRAEHQAAFAVTDAEAKAAAARQAQDAYVSQVRADAGTLAADRDSLVREIVGKTKELADIEKAMQKAKDKIALLIA